MTAPFDWPYSRELGAEATALFKRIIPDAPTADVAIVFSRLAPGRRTWVGLVAASMMEEQLKSGDMEPAFGEAERRYVFEQLDALSRRLIAEENEGIIRLR